MPNIIPNTGKRVRAPVGTVSRTKQNFKDETDVNLIVARHRKGGGVSHLNNGAQAFGDFTQAGDLKEMIDRVQAARDSFATLPSAVRAVASNDPVELLAMIGDDEGQQILYGVGLTLEGVEYPPDEPAESEDTSDTTSTTEAESTP